MNTDVLIICIGIRAALLMQFEPWERWAGLACIVAAGVDIIWRQMTDHRNSRKSLDFRRKTR